MTIAVEVIEEIRTSEDFVNRRPKKKSRSGTGMVAEARRLLAIQGQPIPASYQTNRREAEDLQKAVIGHAQVMGGGFTRDIECGKEFPRWADAGSTA